MKIKIFHIIPQLTSGGAEQLLTTVVGNTSKEKFTHVVCVLGRAELFGEEIQRSGNELIELNLTGKHPWMAATRRILPLIKKIQPDIVQSWLYDATITSRLVNFRYQKIPLVNSLHSSDYEPETIEAGNWSPSKVEGLRLIDKFTARAAKPYFVACSHFVAESYENRLGINPSRIKVIHNLIAPQNLSSEPDEPKQIRQSLGIPEDAFVYTEVGRLDPPKGQFYLIKAFARVLREVPSAHLVLIGTGPSENDYKQLAKSLNVEHRVHFLGRIKNVGAHLEMSNVFVFPTLFEGFGIALVEAMAKELPCIATRLAAIEEIVDDNVSGLLIEPKSEEELAETMVRVFKQPELRKRLGQQAFKKVKNQFFADVLIPKWENFYEEIL